MKWLAFVAYLATIPAANWMIGNVGQCIHGAPCLVPVGFGLEAPSGVLMIGAALVLRDVLHSLLGVRRALLAIALGAVVSAGIAPPALVIASTAAFLLSELADMAIYSPLRARRLGLALLLSGLAGAAIDSAVFLYLAFGSLEFIAGQIIGKLWMTFAASGALLLMRARAA